MKIHDTCRFLLFVFLIFFSLHFLPTAHPFLSKIAIPIRTRVVKVNETPISVNNCLGINKDIHYGNNIFLLILIVTSICLLLTKRPSPDCLLFVLLIFFSFLPTTHRGREISTVRCCCCCFFQPLIYKNLLLLFAAPDEG